MAIRLSHIHNYQLKIKYNYDSLVIERSQRYAIDEHYIKNNLTTREHFMGVYNETIKSISYIV